MTIDPLVTSTDPDWADYQADDPTYFLTAAGGVIRKYVGWHIYPNIATTVTNVRLGARGIIVLPTRYLTAVDSLAIQQHTGDPITVDSHDYVWYQSGYIQRTNWPYVNGSYLGGYYYGNDPYYVPQGGSGLVTCAFHHGYADLPEDVKSVAFELAEQAMTMRSGNLKGIQSPGGFLAQTSQPFGLNLNDEQKNRLANYKTVTTA